MSGKLSNQTGKQAEAIVKERLWSNGFKVKDLSLAYNQGLFFDLLVNDKYRVEVKSSNYQIIVSKKFGTTKVIWNIQGLRPSHFDILAVVLNTIMDKTAIYFIRKESLSEFCKNTNTDKFGITLTEKRITEYFTTSLKSLI